jgi:hypothetical protein
VIGFTDHVQMVTTSNYNALANWCTRLLTTAHNKYSKFVITSRFLVTDPNNVLCLSPYRLANIPQLTKFESNSNLCYDRRSVGQSVLVSSTHLGLTTRFLFLSDSCGYVDVGHHL